MKGTFSWDYSVSGVLVTSLLVKKVQLLYLMTVLIFSGHVQSLSSMCNDMFASLCSGPFV
jgi:hypothetical protein